MMSDTQREQLIKELGLRSFKVKAFTDLHSSVTTKDGDEGTTELLFGSVVPKWHPRIRLIGKLDHLSSVLNLAKLSTSDKIQKRLYRLQEILVYVMGEVATPSKDRERFLDNYHSLTEADVSDLESSTRDLQNRGAEFTGWVKPMRQTEAILEIARTVARESESMAWELVDQGELRVIIARWINRLSDFLWAFARAND